MRVLVCGGRKYWDYAEVSRMLNDIHIESPISTLIHGAAQGADALAGRWASANNIPVISCPARWDLDGKAAGPIRNTRMLRYEPDLVVAFPGGKGTADMVTRAKKAGIKVVTPEPPPNNLTPKSGGVLESNG